MFFHVQLALKTPQEIKFFFEFKRNRLGPPVKWSLLLPGSKNPPPPVCVFGWTTPLMVWSLFLLDFRPLPPPCVGLVRGVAVDEITRGRVFLTWALQRWNEVFIRVVPLPAADVGGWDTGVCQLLWVHDAEALVTGSKIFPIPPVVWVSSSSPQLSAFLPIGGINTEVAF